MTSHSTPSRRAFSRALIALSIEVANTIAPFMTDSNAVIKAFAIPSATYLIKFHTPIPASAMHATIVATPPTTIPIMKSTAETVVFVTSSTYRLISTKPATTAETISTTGFAFVAAFTAKIAVLQPHIAPPMAATVAAISRTSAFFETTSFIHLYASAILSATNPTIFNTVLSADWNSFDSIASNTSFTIGMSLVITVLTISCDQFCRRLTARPILLSSVSAKASLFSFVIPTSSAIRSYISSAFLISPVRSARSTPARFKRFSMRSPPPSISARPLTLFDFIASSKMLATSEKLLSSRNLAKRSVNSVNFSMSAPPAPVRPHILPALFRSVATRPSLLAASFTNELNCEPPLLPNSAIALIGSLTSSIACFTIGTMRSIA